MRVSVSVCEYVCIYVYLCICVYECCVYVDVCYMHIYLYVCMYTFAWSECIWLYEYVCVCVCTRACVWIWRCSTFLLCPEPAGVLFWVLDLEKVPVWGVLFLGWAAGCCRCLRCCCRGHSERVALHKGVFIIDRALLPTPWKITALPEPPFLHQFSVFETPVLTQLWTLWWAVLSCVARVVSFCNYLKYAQSLTFSDKSLLPPYTVLYLTWLDARREWRCDRHTDTEKLGFDGPCSFWWRSQDTLKLRVLIHTVEREGGVIAHR